MSEPAEMVASVIGWATSRIAECRRAEDKFTRVWALGKNHGPPQALVESWAERHALEKVLRMLSVEERAS